MQRFFDAFIKFSKVKKLLVKYHLNILAAYQSGKRQSFKSFFRKKSKIILNFQDFELIEVSILQILMSRIANFLMHVSRF